MKKVYYSLLILFIVLLFVPPVIFAEPNTNLNILLHSEDKEDTATHLKLYASDEITPNKSIIYSIVITASVPSPLGQGNVIDQGLIAFVVPEDAEVDYQNIKVYGTPTPDSNKYVEYQPESKSTKELFDILGSIISKIPVLGLVMDLSPIYQARPGDYGEFIDLNQYDIVKVNWEVPRLKYWQKVQIDIPVHLGDDAGIGLYAYWQSRASSADGTGPTFMRDNVLTFNVTKKSIKEKFESLFSEENKKRIAIFHGLGKDDNYIKYHLSTFLRFGLRNVFDISSLDSEAFSLYKGIIIDAGELDKWEPIKFNDFMKSNMIESLIENYVKSGGILIISLDTSYSYGHGKFPINEVLPEGYLWGDLKFRLENSPVYKKITYETNYLFNSSCELVDFIKRDLIDCPHNPEDFGFTGNKNWNISRNWNILLSVEEDILVRLMEQRYGKGRILIFAGNLSVRPYGPSVGNYKELYKQYDIFLQGFSNYIIKYSQIE